LWDHRDQENDSWASTCGWINKTVRHGTNGPVIYEWASFQTGAVESTAGPSKSSSSPCDKRPWWKEDEARVPALTNYLILSEQAVRRRRRLSHIRVAPAALPRGVRGWWRKRGRFSFPLSMPAARDDDCPWSERAR
jgi:hypothetical protein